MVALNLNTSFQDRVNDNTPAIVQRMPVNLSANRSFTQPTSFTLPFNMLGLHSQGLSDDVLEPMEARVSRNIFRTGILDEATKRALLTDTQSIGKFSTKTQAEEQKKKQEQRERIYTRLLLQSMLRTSAFALPKAIATDYIKIATVLAAHRENICKKINELVKNITQKDEEIEQAEELFEQTSAKVKETEAEFYTVGKQRTEALQVVEQTEEETEKAQQELETRQNELNRVQAVIDNASENLARDDKGRVLHLNDEGELYGIDDEGQTHHYNFFQRHYLGMRVKIMNETTGDQYDRCQSGVCDIQDQLEEAQRNYETHSERLQEAHDHFKRTDERYNKLQVFLDNLRTELYELEDEILALKIDRENMLHVLDTLHTERDQLDEYIDDVFSDEETMRALANGNMCIKDLVDQMPDFVRKNYEISLRHGAFNQEELNADDDEHGHEHEHDATTSEHTRLNKFQLN